MNKKIISAVLLLLFAFSVFSFQQTLADEDWVTFQKTEYGFQFKHPSNWNIELDKQPNVLGCHGLPKLNCDFIGCEEITIMLYVLENDKGKSINDFFTAGKVSGEVIMERQNRVENGLEILVVGYEYDPPIWGAISYEAEAMVELSPETFVYMQFLGTKGIELDYLLSTIDKILASIKSI